jgi:uncharacterized protein YbjT (DUF2867 family)
VSNLILVVGATGLVGREVVLRLRKKEANVRAIVRGGSSRAEASELPDAGVEVVDADLTRPDSLSAACAGVQTVVCSATSMPHGGGDAIRRVDRDGTLSLIDAAEQSGVARFVYLSYSGTIQQPSPLETAKRDCEKRLLASSMQTVVLRPTCFTEVWLSPALGFDPKNGTARVYGSGQSPVSWISAFDVADFAVATALAHHCAKEVLELGGPEPLSQLQVVHLFENILHKQIAVQHVSVEALQQQHQSSEPLQKTFAALSLAVAAGDVIPTARDNALRYGVKLHSVRDYAQSLAKS